MLAHATPRKPAPMLACGALWLRWRVGPTAIGNALGESIKDASAPRAQGVGPWSDKGYVNEFDKQSDAVHDARWAAITNALPVTSEADYWNSLGLTQADRYAETYGGIAQPAQFKVEMGGVGWKGDFQLPDGTWVLRSGGDDPRRMIDGLATDALPPEVPGFEPTGEQLYPRLGTKGVYYNPVASDPQMIAAQEGFRQLELAAASADGQIVFQATNDAAVMAGTYSRFSEIGNALSAGRYGDVWRHITFEASDPARAVNNARLFPPQTPLQRRIDAIVVVKHFRTAR